MRERRQDRLEVRKDKVALIIDDARVDEAAPRDLVRLFEVELPSDDPDLARFYLVESKPARWVVPYFTMGSAAGIAALCAGRSASAQLYRATLDVLTWRWRLLGIPFPNVSRLLRCQLGPDRAWTMLEGPLDALGAERGPASPK